MLTISEYCHNFPEHALDFEIPIGEQKRIVNPVTLAELPNELLPESPYTQGGRGRPNRNQTLTHKQCGRCLRVLRNDYYWASPALLKQNVMTTYCKECAASNQLAHYGEQGDQMRVRRLTIWRYIGPRCARCGFDEHPSAIDMHHLLEKDELVSKLVAQLAAAPSPRNARRLIAEAEMCVPLCSNCHRLLHAGCIALSDPVSPLTYDIQQLLELIHSADGGDHPWQPELAPGQ